MLARTDCQKNGLSWALILFAALLFCLSPAVSRAQEESQPTSATAEDLASLSLESLMDIRITSVSRKAEKLFDATSAVYVITQEDIQRSGSTNIPEALRLVPGIQVAQVDASNWAISSRGFNDVYANKLLVILDGRSMYTPLFSGVYWDTLDVVMEDIDRIEVVRGPGATMWGANAVNGVINVVTKPAGETRNTLVTETVGSFLRNTTAIRHGGALGRNADYRIYGKYLDRGNSVDPAGGDAYDRWHTYRGGFRVDWDVSDKDVVTFLGDVAKGSKKFSRAVPTLPPPFSALVENDLPVSTGNFLTRWTRTRSSNSDSTLQVYYDRTTRDQPQVIEGENWNNLDLDFQQRRVLGRHDVVYGAGYRRTTSSLRDTFNVSLQPRSRTINLYSAFVQDEMNLVQHRASLTLGSKFEHNDYTGFDIQPSIRLMWTPDSTRTGWLAVSRAVRTPSRVEKDSRANLAAFPDQVDPNLIYLVSVLGNSDLLSEDVVAYELGYRKRNGERLCLDLAAFYNVYTNLVTANPGTPVFEISPPPPHIMIPYDVGYGMSADSYGFEVSADWRPTNSWRVVSGYTYFQLKLHDLQQGGISNNTAGSSPRNQFFMRSSTELPGKVGIDAVFRYVDKLTGLGIPSYFTMDLRLAKKTMNGLEFSLVGQNLLQESHMEFTSLMVPLSRTEVPRSVYANLMWRF